MASLKSRIERMEKTTPAEAPGPINMALFQALKRAGVEAPELMQTEDKAEALQVARAALCGTKLILSDDGQGSFFIIETAIPRAPNDPPCEDTQDA